MTVYMLQHRKGFKENMKERVAPTPFLQKQTKNNTPKQQRQKKHGGRGNQQ